MEPALLLERAELLLEQGRPKDAQTNIRQALELDPENDHALSLLCRCHYSSKQYAEGIAIIHQAISLDPHNSFYFYLLAFGHYQQGRIAAATENLNKALELYPYSSEYFGLFSYVLLQAKKFEEALEKANEGLAVDAENVTCLNARSVALNKLKRTDAAIETMQNALAQDPDNEMTHATVGWNLLEKGKHKEATRHFLEALRIDPNYDNARSGLKEALKSKVPPYRWLLQYSFWVNDKGRKLQTALPIVLYIAFRILIGLFSNTNHSELAWIFGGLYILIVVASWTISSIANFFLLFNPIGKYALTTSEKWSAITVVTGLFIGLSLLGIATFTSVAVNTVYNESLFGAGLVCLSLALPLGEIEYPVQVRNIRGWRRWFSFSLAVLGIVSLLLFCFLPQQSLPLFLLYGLAFIIYNWSGIGK